jgi:hypothetical protein
MNLKFTFAILLKYCLSSQKLIWNMKHRSRQELLHENFSAMVSVVGIATRYVLIGPGIESWRWRDFLTRPEGPCGPPSLLYRRYQNIQKNRATGAWHWQPTSI